MPTRTGVRIAFMIQIVVMKVSITNAKPVCSTRRRILNGRRLDESRHLSFDVFQKKCHLVRGSFRDQLDIAIP